MWGGGAQPLGALPEPSAVVAIRVVPSTEDTCFRGFFLVRLFLCAGSPVHLSWLFNMSGDDSAVGTVISLVVFIYGCFLNQREVQ